MKNIEIQIPELVKDLGCLVPTMKNNYKVRFGIYKCPICGKNFKCRTTSILTGNTKSCGCSRLNNIIKSRLIHGMTNTKLYYIWSSMKRRCNSIIDVDYNGRGIIVCDEWKNDFMSFYNWAISNGYGEGLQIDRIDVNGNYEPANCRWVDNNISAQNKRIKRKDNTSGYRCVFPRNKNYQVRIRAFGKYYYIGSFKTAKEAAIAYNNTIIKNGWHHPLNKI